MKLLLSYDDGVERCEIAQAENFLLPLTACCGTEFEVLGGRSVYTCSRCRGTSEVYTWLDDSDVPLPTSLVLTKDTISEYHARIIEWLSTWTGIPQDELSIEVTW